MLRKKDTVTVITPIPGFIPRQLAIDILHSHAEVITLNPLVLSHKAIPAPHNAETDEYYSTWYEITERIQFLPGIGKMGASTIKFNGCFHDMPWGLQTHIYAPMNVDLRNKYCIAGNQPGVEPPEIPEIGLKSLGAPSDGLYLREDIEIKCNITVMSFVKSQLKKAGGEMVSRIIKKAELLDAGVLQAMIEDGMLKTINPADRSNLVRSPLASPTTLHYSPSVSGSPPVGSTPTPTPYQVPRVSRYSGFYRPSTAGSQGGSTGYPPNPGSPGFAPPDAQQSQAGGSQIPMEMPGDFYHAALVLQPGRQTPQQSASSPGSRRESLIDPSQQQKQQQQQQHYPSTNTSPNLGQQQQQQHWTTSSAQCPMSIPSTVGSPGILDNKAAGLGFSPPTGPHPSEYRDGDAAAPRTSQPPQYVPYNPADFAKPPGVQHPQYAQGQGQRVYSYTQ
ncbi:hypothetical protein C8A05DRAFT_17720 [Staphylotrichum tortipilum]|uniref:DUF7053 domain-containing protein n=1 Tax=Staphylotrichum tortipilum TaxID=2831512 RepID=A0AAN6MFG9_9PEZI|nr:hypothetical protein C8A05DRAFT_17720 [Staphylotrichum longicolle]